MWTRGTAIWIRGGTQCGRNAFVAEVSGGHRHRAHGQTAVRPHRRQNRWAELRCCQNCARFGIRRCATITASERHCPTPPVLDFCHRMRLHMRRWIFVLLLLLAPFQLLWAAAVPYCTHEASAAAAHFGHHEHRHGGGEGGEKKCATSLASSSEDCEVCHFAHAVSMPPAMSIPGATLAVGSFVAYSPPYSASPKPSGPERPDRSHAPVSPRFGGGAVLLSSMYVR